MIAQVDGTGGSVRVSRATNITDTRRCLEGATVEAWINTSDPTAGVVATNRSNPNEHSLTMVVGYNTIGLRGVNGRVMFISDGPGTFFGVVSRQRVDDGQWHHVVGRRTSPGGREFTYEVFIDGVLDDTDSLPGVGTAQSGVNGTDWLIGNGTAWPAAGAAFNGMIDEVAVYCGPLADSLIAQHYTIGRPCGADFNLDGSRDADDLGDYITCYFSVPACHRAEFNRDGNVDADDLGDFFTTYFGPAC